MTMATAIMTTAMAAIPTAPSTAIITATIAAVSTTLALAAAGIRIIGIRAMASTSLIAAADATKCTIIIVAIGEVNATNGIANIIAIVTAMTDAGAMTRNVTIVAGAWTMAIAVTTIETGIRLATDRTTFGTVTDAVAMVVATGVGIACKTAVTRYNKYRP